MEKAWIDQSYKQGFILKPEHIEKMTSICTERLQLKGIDTRLKYKVHRADYVMYETHNSTDVLQEENAERNKIQRLSIEFSTDDIECIVSFDKDTHPRIEITSTDKDFAAILRDELERYINTEISTSQFIISDIWQSIIQILLFYLVFLGMATIAFQKIIKSLITFDRYDSLEKRNEALSSTSILEKMDYLIQREWGQVTLNPLQHPTTIFWMFITIIISLIIFFLSRKLLDMYFSPRSIIHWGKEKDRHDKFLTHRHLWTWGVFIALFIGILSSIIASGIFKTLSSLFR